MEALWDKLQFWKKLPKKYKEGKHFSLVDYETDIIAVKLTFFMYNNVMYHYTGVKVVEHGELATLKFGYKLLNSGNYTKESLEKDPIFTQVMGDILMVLLTEKEHNGSFRKNYSEEFDLF